MRIASTTFPATLAAALALASLASCAVPASPSDDEVAAAASELRICAAGPTVSGIDVSHWDGMVDWPAVRASGVAFSFIKASQGTSYTDDTFARNWTETRRNDVMRGAYHFFCPKMNGTDQADHFLGVMGAMEPDDLPPVLDVESCSTAVCGSACDWSGVSCGTIATNIQRFVDRVAAVTGRTPMIYTGVGSWDGAVCGSTDFAELPLWVANYGVTCPSVPAAWSDWQFWQTGDAGRVPGITTAVDMNVFNGDMAALRAFVGSAPPMPACGDGTCDASETCTSCASDCGACPPPPRDAGMMVVGVDAGVPVVGDDAGVTMAHDDAGVPVRGDASVMAPVTPRSVGAMSGSCGCSVPGTRGHTGALSGIAGLSLLWVIRRRRLARSR